MSGFWAGDAIAQTIDNAQLKELLYKKQHIIDSIAADNAANLAEKMALRKALAKHDPQHPLLINKELRERIHKAGENALSIKNDWDDCREAGEKFEY